MSTLAPALAQLRAQVDKAFPGRNKASDGWIASGAHLGRTGAGAAASQHNPNVSDVVCAIDITEDLSVGLNCNLLMDQLDASNDPRIFYLIHDRAIDNSDDSRTPYTGSNPHTKHMHISTWYTKPAIYNDARAWSVPMLSGTVSGPSPAPVSGNRPGSSLPSVRSRARSFQQFYNACPFVPALLPIIKPTADNFGPQSLAALKKVQAFGGTVNGYRCTPIAADGIDGPMTKEKLWSLGWRG